MSVPAPESGTGIASPHIFLEIAEIKGESRSKNHEDEIEVLAWSWGEVQNVFPSEKDRKATPNVAMQDFQITTNTSAASAQFILHCAAAKKLKSAVLYCEHDHKGGRHNYLTITLTGVYISSYQLGASGGDHAVDSLSLRFTKIEFTYTPLKPDGTPGSNFSCSWDLSENKT